MQTQVEETTVWGNDTYSLDDEIAVFARDDYRNTGIETFEANTIPYLLKDDNVHGIDFEPRTWYPFSITIEKLAAGRRLKNKVAGYDKAFIFSQDRVVFNPDDVETDIIPYVHDIIPVTAMYKRYSDDTIRDRLRGYLSTVMGTRYIKFIANCSHVIASSHTTAQELRERTAYTGSIDVVYQGVDDMPDQELNDPGSRDIDLLYVGSTIERKNPELLRQAFKAANEAGYTTAAVNHSGIDVPGPTYTNISDAELAELYNRARFYLHPSRHEGFGRTPVEAQRYGATPLALPIQINDEVLGQEGRHWHRVERQPGQAVADILHHVANTEIQPSVVQENSERFTWRDTRVGIVEALQR